MEVSGTLDNYGTVIVAADAQIPGAYCVYTGGMLQVSAGGQVINESSGNLAVGVVIYYEGTFYIGDNTTDYNGVLNLSGGDAVFTNYGAVTIGGTLTIGNADTSDINDYFYNDGGSVASMEINPATHYEYVDNGTTTLGDGY